MKSEKWYHDPLMVWAVGVNLIIAGGFGLYFFLQWLGEVTR